MSRKTFEHSEAYILQDDTEKVWGVFNDKVLMYGMYENLTSLIPKNRTISILLLTMNTNTVIKEWKDVTEIKKQFHPSKFQCDANETKSEQIPKELRQEWCKLNRRLSEFKGNFDVFKKMLKDGLISLDTDINDVPELLRDKYNIFSDIIRLEIPEDECFGYYMDRYYYIPQKFDYLD